MKFFSALFTGTIFLLNLSCSFALNDDDISDNYLVVGNGILGLSTAYEILNNDPDAAITLIAPKQTKGASTRAAGAMVGCFGEITEGVFHSPEHTKKFLIGYEAKKQWEAWYQKLKSHPYLSPEKQKASSFKKGTFIILNTISGDLDTINFDLIRKKLNEYREPYELLAAGELAKRIKGYNPNPQHRSALALWLPNEGFIDPNDVLDCLIEIIEKHKNARVIDDYAAEILTNERKVTGIKTKQENIFKSNKVILATGAFTQQLTDTVPELKGKIRMLSGMGYAFVMPNIFGIEHVIRTPNRAGACGLHVVPRPDGTLYVGASNNVRKTPAFYPTLDIATFVQTCVMEQINVKMCNSEIIQLIIGNRPVSLDGLPLLGKSESIDGLYFITGTYRDGLAHSPVLSKKVVDHMINGTEIEEGLFTPERDPIQTYEREELIAEAVKHTMAATHERQVKLPLSNWDQVNQQAYTLIFNELYSIIYKEYEYVSLDLLLGIFDSYSFRNNNEKNTNRPKAKL